MSRPLHIHLPTYPRLSYELSNLLTLTITQFVPLLLPHPHLQPLLDSIVSQLLKINPYQFLLRLSTHKTHTLREAIDELIETLIPGKKIMRIYMRELAVDWVEGTAVVEERVLRNCIYMVKTISHSSLVNNDM
jgi:hypothetical protein